MGPPKRVAFLAVSVEMRFCNIVDGYVPMVKEVRRILPSLVDGESIEVSWQDEPDSWFPCKVSRSKRAIYNLDGRLKSVFKPFPSGVRLHITRVGARRYVFGVKRKPHTVPNCKIFVSDGIGGWKAEIRDNEPVEWETGDQVFRHQLTLQQMDGLRDEARRVGLSVRDAVHDVMKRLAQEKPLHVRSVHDAVFLWMRTCSLASVWAQFRPEHQCYVRIQPGWYRFDSSKPLPQVRHIVLPSRRGVSLPRYSRQERHYRVKQRTWRHNIYRSRLEEYRNNENACLEVRCAFGTPEETVFLIPIPYLLEHVIPHAHCTELGRYLFTVNPHDLVFTWDHGFRMEGKRFVDQSKSGSEGLVEYV